MTSILEYSERKKKRTMAAQKVSTPAPPAKKQKVTHSHSLSVSESEPSFFR